MGTQSEATSPIEINPKKSKKASWKRLARGDTRDQQNNQKGFEKQKVEVQQCDTHGELESDGKGNKKFKFQDGVLVVSKLLPAKMASLDHFSATFDHGSTATRRQDDQKQ